MSNDQNDPSHIPQFFVDVETLPSSGLSVSLKQDEAQNDAVFDLLQIQSMPSFRADLEFKRWAKKGVQVSGRIKADVSTQCPVSLEPVTQNIETNLNARFVPANSHLAKPKLDEEGEIVLSMDSDDLPDIYEGHKLDAWAIALEYLALEIDPFARAPDAQFSPATQGMFEDTEQKSPFEVLKGLKEQK